MTDEEIMKFVNEFREDLEFKKAVDELSKIKNDGNIEPPEIKPSFDTKNNNQQDLLL